jgi:hypothetical protein
MVYQVSGTNSIFAPNSNNANAAKFLNKELPLDAKQVVEAFQKLRGKNPSFSKSVFNYTIYKEANADYLIRESDTRDKSALFFQLTTDLKTVKPGAFWPPSIKEDLVFLQNYYANPEKERKKISSKKRADSIMKERLIMAKTITKRLRRKVDHTVGALDDSDEHLKKNISKYLKGFDKYYIFVGNYPPK